MATRQPLPYLICGWDDGYAPAAEAFQRLVQCFPLNIEKILVQIRNVVFEKNIKNRFYKITSLEPELKLYDNS